VGRLVQNVHAGIRIFAGLVTATLFLFFISQVTSDPALFLVFGLGSEILGFATYSRWRVNVATIAGDLSGILLLLPLIYVALTIPNQLASQSVAATTNWLATYFQGLPASVVGDLGGTLAAVVMGF